MFSLPMGEDTKLHVYDCHTEKNSDFSMTCRQTSRAYAFSPPESSSAMNLHLHALSCWISVPVRTRRPRGCSGRMDAALPLLVQPGGKKTPFCLRPYWNILTSCWTISTCISPTAWYYL